MTDQIFLQSDDRETVVEVGGQVYLPNILSEAITSFLREYHATIDPYLVKSKHIHTKIIPLLDGMNSRMLQPGNVWISGKVSIKVNLEFVPEVHHMMSETINENNNYQEFITSPLDDLRENHD